MRDGTATPRWTEWPSREWVPCEKCQDENLMCDESCAPLSASGLTPQPKDKPATLANEAANQRFPGSGQTQARESAASGAPDGEAKRYRACVCCTPPRAWPHDEDPTEGRTDDGYDEMGLPGTRIGAGAAATAETCGSVVARGESRHATHEAAGGDPGSAPVGHSARESVLLAFTLPHKGHDGIPGAPEGVLCVRCVAERALDRLLSDLAAAERREEQLREALAPTAETRDYLSRTIATIRNHRDADNCWPQWANRLADEVERMWGALADVGGDEAGDLVSTSTKFKEAIAALKAAEQEAVATQNTASTEGHGA